MKQESSRYVPHVLLDAIKTRFKLKNDKELSAFIGITTATLSRIRHGHYRLTEVTILRIHEATEWPSLTIRDLYNQQKIIDAKANRGEK